MFSGFLLLVFGSTAATFWVVRAQADDARLINLAGRQRMLTQKMTWLALTQPDSPELSASIRLFEQTLSALRDGGPAPASAGLVVELPAASDARLRDLLDQVMGNWAAFRAHLQPPQPAALQAQSPHILAQLDAVVSNFETQARSKILRLQLIQAAFLLGAIGMLAWGYRLTERHILRPLDALGQAARQIGAGELRAPVEVAGADELQALGRNFDGMRAELAAARDDLEWRVARRTRELTAALEFSQEIVAQPDLQPLLRSVPDRARALAHGRAASLCLLDETGDTLWLTATSGRGAAGARRRRAAGRALARRVVGDGQVVVTEAVCAECRFLRAQAPGACLAAPLRAGDQTLGALCVVRRPDEPFDPDETRALTLLANSAAVAIANARLAQAERRQAEQAAAGAERDRLAAELHDHLAQTLSYLQLKTDRVQTLIAGPRSGEADAELARMRSALGDAYAQVRQALTGLREPAPAARHDLAQKLAACLAEFRDTASAEVELVMPAAALPLPPLAQAQAAHIVREALANVRRHADAAHARVRIERIDGRLQIEVEDDGRGFDPAAVAQADHLGLGIMRMRAERIGGSLSVRSTPGRGTRITATLPIAEARPVLGSLMEAA